MNWMEIIVVFVMVWWMVLFMVLPVGVKRDESPQKGNASGAPKQANMVRKLWITTGIAVCVTGLYIFLMSHGYFDFIELRSKG